MSLYVVLSVNGRLKYMIKAVSIYTKTPTPPQNSPHTRVHPKAATGEELFLYSHMELGPNSWNELIGATHTLDFLEKHTVVPCRTPSVWSTPRMPTERVLMLFGRKGSGKKTIVDHWLASHRHKKGPDFDAVKFHWEAWNHDGFLAWADEMMSDMLSIDDNDGDKDDHDRYSTMIIVIHGVQMLNYLHASQYETKLMKLLYAVRSDRRLPHVFVIMTCDESPGKFHKELRRLIDYECYVPPPEPAERKMFFRRWVAEFKAHCDENIPLRHAVDFDVDLEDEDGIIATLCTSSAGCNPHEIHVFLEQAFRACINPRITHAESAGKGFDSVDNNFAVTEFSDELLMSLIKTHKNRMFITDYDPLEANKGIRDHLGLSAEVTKDDADILHLRGQAVDPTAQPLLSKIGKRKRDGKNGEEKVRDMNKHQEMIQKEAEKRRKLTEKADRKEAERKTKTGVRKEFRW